MSNSITWRNMRDVSDAVIVHACESPDWAIRYQHCTAWASIGAVTPADVVVSDSAPATENVPTEPSFARPPPTKTSRLPAVGADVSVASHVVPDVVSDDVPTDCTTEKAMLPPFGQPSSGNPASGPSAHNTSSIGFRPYSARHADAPGFGISNELNR